MEESHEPPRAAHCGFSSFILLQTSVVCPVFESITVVSGRQLQVTVLAFSCLVTTQCSITSEFAGGNSLRMGGAVVATGFFAAQPVRSRHTTSQPFLMSLVVALSRQLVDGNLDYRSVDCLYRARQGSRNHGLQSIARRGLIADRWFYGGGGGSRTRVRKCYWSRAYMRSRVPALGITRGRSRPALRTDKKRVPLA